MTVSRTYILAAGGTGGHIIPAYALAVELMQRGHRVALVTDDRGMKIPGCPDELARHVLPAGRGGGGPRGWLAAARSIARGRLKCCHRLWRLSGASGLAGGICR
jgi:UDP-N-acetylglucosamine--N-acetylmuramyl-(pentapeptide) pyrophosphoryl-undecaprenol N-acetylglucosamine transferase